MLRRRHLGRVSFAEANDVQRALLEANDDYVLLFEHPATYTRGIRTLDEHFLIPPSELDAVVVDADRGGDVTYHAPGQVVAWAIVSVAEQCRLAASIPADVAGPERLLWLEYFAQVSEELVYSGVGTDLNAAVAYYSAWLRLDYGAAACNILTQFTPSLAADPVKLAVRALLDLTIPTGSGTLCDSITQGPGA